MNTVGTAKVRRSDATKGRTRDQIVAAADEMITKKGVQDATVSEIASAAGVTESVIYHYFKNKEDLLFSITGRHLEEVLKVLHEQLEGILEPTSRLSKMIWFHLKYNETHREYSRILLFECRSNRNFYLHETYHLIRQYSDVMLAILADGVKRGAFREDVNMRLVRDLILGFLDWETIKILTSNTKEHTLADIEAVMDLICTMIQMRHIPTEDVPDKATRVLNAAEMLFSEKGYRSSSISEIARMADVAEGTVYEYFDNKEALLFAIPAIRFKDHIESLSEVFEIKTPIRKLRRFIKYHFLLYMNQPEFLKTLLTDVLLNARYYQTEAYARFQEYSSLVDRILEEGKQAGTVRESVRTDLFKSLFFGGFCHLALRWLIVKSGPDLDKMSEVNQMVELLTEAASAR